MYEIRINYGLVKNCFIVWLVKYIYSIFFINFIIIMFDNFYKSVQVTEQFFILAFILEPSITYSCNVLPYKETYLELFKTVF